MGLVPFAVLFIELLFVFKNLWQDKSGYYYVFGFLSAVSAILIVTVSEVTIIATYSQLCAEVRKLPRSSCLSVVDGVS
jgi:transmembrane 9 superfamily member 2/4